MFVHEVMLFIRWVVDFIPQTRLYCSVLYWTALKKSPLIFYFFNAFIRESVQLWWFAFVQSAHLNQTCLELPKISGLNHRRCSFVQTLMFRWTDAFHHHRKYGWWCHQSGDQAMMKCIFTLKPPKPSHMFMCCSQWHFYWTKKAFLCSVLSSTNI